MKRTIMIIDDDQSIRMLLEHFLSNEYTIVTQEDGTDALAYMQKGNIPDLIVSDLGMPKMSGFDFITNIRMSTFFKDIPLIVLSGHENSEEKIKSLRLGADDYLVKPFNPEELKLRIESIFRRIECASRLTA